MRHAPRRQLTDTRRAPRPLLRRGANLTRTSRASPRGPAGRSASPSGKPASTRCSLVDTGMQFCRTVPVFERSPLGNCRGTSLARPDTGMQFCRTVPVSSDARRSLRARDARWPARRGRRAGEHRRRARAPRESRRRRRESARQARGESRAHEPRDHARRDKRHGLCCVAART
jgi:hypothetical protein